MREFLIALVGSLLIAVVCLSHALLRHPPYAVAAEAASAPYKCEQCLDQPANGKEEPTESWSIGGYRLKITDTLVALFTALLFMATLALYFATRNLVRGADRTAEKQLRAYVYVERTRLTFNNNTGWDHSFRIKNFGLTPAHNVQLQCKTKVVNWNNRDAEKPKAADARIVTLGSMAPNGDFFEEEPTVEQLPNGQIIQPAELQQDATKAIFMVGSVTYRTIFGASVRTDFSYYVGGNRPYLGGEMYADPEGNDAA